MSELNRLLDAYVPPDPPADLAARAAEAAALHRRRRTRSAWRRSANRGGWSRGVMIAGTSLGLAFTSAVAATVVSEGRIEIPVVTDVAAAIPVIGPRVRENVPEPVRLAKREAEPAQRPPAAETRPTEDAAPTDLRRQRAEHAGAAIRQRIEERRAAGLPTPRADRIQARARQIVERRQAAGKPTPPVEQVERALALREYRVMRQRQQMRQQVVASSISDEQLRRFADRLPPLARQRFDALDPVMQRQAVARWSERIRARRSLQLGLQRPATPEAPTPAPRAELVAGSEGYSEQPR
ncbi:MAG TPA: hypothetical protein VFK58_00750 [Sphingomicrobium sp.]|nr:hypothetical protein [Sphingomicrobium sp.]